MTTRLMLHHEGSLSHRLSHFPVGLLVLLSLLAGVGILALYSAGGGAFDPWADRQFFRFILAVILMLGVALVDIRIWFRLAYVFYAVMVFLLVVVEVKGHIGMGAQRWINLGFMQLQPSEFMKIATVLMLARYFQNAHLEQVRRPLFLLPVAGFLVLPVGLVMLQPDLGTAVKILVIGGALFFLAGVPLWMFGVVGGAGLAALPVAWGMLHDYQRNRVLTFMNPEADPLGTGYHITQSKIALGSGGIFGKGYLQGTQSHLDFLPEKHTDFVFTLWAEEWGLFGSLFLMFLYALIVAYGFWMAFRVQHRFGRLLALGVTLNFSLYALINIAMVMGVIPVVGVPLVMVSYGGTAMLSVMFGFGLMASAFIHRDAKIPRS